MKYLIIINHDKKYIHYSHSGLVERSEIGQAWGELLNLEEFSKLKYNLLSDYRGAKFNFTASETNVIENFLLSIKPILDGKRNAVIVDKPSETVISLLFEAKMASKINFQIKTFYTEEAAVSFLS